ncbi:MAG TPA: argininosuccinate lyase [Phycisphaerales bacterium]|nr:argininosuccinate lyase [Phycisphaerales bacterium]HMP37254.1 argininosuccinate lyase [Phycisphaerales bacterium]
MGSTGSALWGSRFGAPSDPLFRAFNDSIGFDHELVAEDIEGSIAWAHALVRAGVLTAEESQRLEEALAALRAEARADPIAVAESDAEDVHSWVESALVERLGPLGRKLHTGRSRNDQVATDLRLWSRGAIRSRRAELRAAIAALVDLAERELDTVLPGMTHLQHGQPILFSHWALAYVEMLRRDDGRFADALRRLDECPLGSGALAGTAYPIDRVRVAAELGFARPTRNSLDAVSDRDFVVESLAAAALCAVHLSRLAEDLIIFSSEEFRFVEMADAVTSGSSLMPQKKNPDAMELVRGKVGRIIGALTTILIVLKGLPMAYNKDLQEDKEPLFDAMGQLSMALRMVVPTVATLRVDRAQALDSAGLGHTNATELADYLVHAGVPFRDAHEVVGRVVRHALARRLPIEALALEELRGFDPRFGPEVREWLAPEAAVARRDVEGGTAPRRVRAAIEEARAWLAAAQEA